MLLSPLFNGQLYLKKKKKKAVYKISVLKTKQDTDLNDLSEYSEEISGTKRSN